MRSKWGKTVIVVLLIYSFSGLAFAAAKKHQGIGVGLHGGVMNFMGDFTPIDFGYLGEASVEMPLSRHFSAMIVGGFGQQQFGPDNDIFTTQLMNFDIRGAFRLPVTSFICPMVYVGAGAINFKRGDMPRYWDGAGIAGAGIELKLGKRLGLSVAADYRYTSGDDFDGVTEGGPDTYVTAKAGLNYYFSNDKKEEQAPLAAKVIKLGDKEQTGEDFLAELAAAEEKSAIKSVKSSVASDTELLNRIKQLNETIAQRERNIVQMKSELEETDRKIAYLELEVQGKSSQPINLGESVDFQDQYEMGIQKFNDKVFVEAAGLFEALIQADPTNKLAGNCQYWIGECEYAAKNFDKAIAAFEKSLEYANSPKNDDAMIMLGLSYKRVAHEEIAQQYFERLLAEYPDSEYASLARRHLGMN